MFPGVRDRGADLEDSLEDLRLVDLSREAFRGFGARRADFVNVFKIWGWRGKGAKRRWATVRDGERW